MKKTKDKLLITGVSGLLGSNLVYYFKEKYEVLGLYNAHPVAISGIYPEQCDLLDGSQTAAVVAAFAPSVIIHCASATNIDQCETDKVSTEKINVVATRNLVGSVHEKDVKLIYISTDAVYDGDKGFFAEDGPVSPRNYYGITKFEGEKEVQKNSNTLVVRTNIFGWNIQRKKSLGEWILDELTANRTINCFHDAYFSSIYTLELARAIDIAIQRDLKGVYNCGSSDSCSKYEFALKLASYFGLDANLIKSISIDNFNFKAKRGKNLSLNVNKFQKKLNYKLPTIDQSVEAFYRDFKSGVPAELKEGTVAANREASFIPYGRQWISEGDIQSVVNILRSDRLTQGPTIESFEEALSAYCGARYAVAMNSATSVLHATCLAAGVGAGDEVITSPITFVASANCAVYCGAKPVFADIDLRTYNIDPKEIEKKITERTKAIITVHFAGQSCDMSSIYEIVKAAERKYGRKIYIIEDACHALGSLYKNKKVGSCVYSDMAVMSFHPVKHITTGEGGVALTNDETLYKKLKKIRSHGITSTPEEFMNRDLAFQHRVRDDGPLPNPWYYEQVTLGYNYRITDIQSALGLSQLGRLDLFRHRRRGIVEKYNKEFRTLENITLPYEDRNCDSNFHLYVVLFDFEGMRTDRARVMAHLRSNGIQTQVHYIPVHLQPFYRQRFGTKAGDCPRAENYYRQCLSVPLFPAMNDQDVEKVIGTVTAAMQGR